MSEAREKAHPGSCRDGSCPATLSPSDAALCPSSHSIGSRVDLITVKALLRGRALRRLDGKAYRFCQDPDCEVVYFDREAESIFQRSDLAVRVGQKQSADPIPICYCFDVTIADLRSDLATFGATPILEMIASEVKAGHCACEVKNPQGSCCLGNISKTVEKILVDLRAAAV